MEKDYKILLVDDEKDFLYAMSSWLSSIGYNVEITENGNDAVKKIKQNYFDLVFLDVVMPEMDGIETLRKIREINPDLSVIMITAHTSNKRIIEAEELGVSGFFRKTSDFSHVSKMIQACLDKLNNKENY